MKLLILLFMSIYLLYANEIDAVNLVKKLSLSAGSKAIVQWERIFKSSHKMQKYKINTLNTKEQELLKEYLIDHAIDSDQPTIAGA
jgi:hypothetical protein